MNPHTASARWMYRGHRPNGLARLLNRAWAFVGAAGLWPRLITLEVRGRKSGRLVSFPLIVVRYQGERYVVSMLGYRAAWVSNVEAAGGLALLRHGECEAVRLERIPVEERPLILKRYLQLAPGARPHIPVSHRAPSAAFADVASRYPVFRLKPVRGTSKPAIASSRRRAESPENVAAP